MSRTFDAYVGGARIGLWRTFRGSVAPGFELVKVAFEENMVSRGEVGAAVSVWHRGREVVNVAGGVVTPGGAPYGPDTLQVVFSTTKGAVAICVGMCRTRPHRPRRACRPLLAGVRSGG
jgi:CubicO group peptidase (beta-lactamase class C family)